MGTITKTIAETSGQTSTWTVEVSMSNIIANNSSFSVPVPSLRGKYTAYSGKNYSESFITANTYINGIKIMPPSGYLGTSYSLGGSLAGNTWKASTNYYTQQYTDTPAYAVTVQTNSVFTSANSTTRTVNITLQNVCYALISSNYGSTPRGVANGTTAEQDWGTLATVTLNAPPTFDSTQVYFDSDIVYAKYTTASVDVSNLSPKYGGYITSVVLKIGNQTASRTTDGTLSINLNAVGTFTPEVIVTDSRGQITTQILTNINVLELPDTTFSYSQVMSSTSPYFYTQKSDASVQIRDINVYPGTDNATAKLIIGNQSESRDGNGEVTISSLNTANNFIPRIELTDIYGRTYTQELDEITVLEYTVPNFSFELHRTTNTGKEDEESGKYCVVAITSSFISNIATLCKPIIQIDGESEEVEEGEESHFSILWFKNWNKDDGVSNEINWNLNPPDISPCTIYGLVAKTDDFEIYNSYDITVQLQDSAGGSSIVLIQRLPQAFYTIDILAGGKGVAFGQPSAKEGFYCSMDEYISVDSGDDTDLYRILQTIDSSMFDEDNMVSLKEILVHALTWQ